MAYILDTNIFIRSKNEMPFDLWPSFWAKVQQLVTSGQVYSCVKVKAEIDKGKDELTQWMRNNAPSSFFIPLDASNTIFKPEAKREYAINADAYLVATAKAKGLTLVTYETSDPNCRKRVKIPDACIDLGVRYCDLNTMLRELQITI